MKLAAIMWDAYLPLMKHAARITGVDLTIYANRTLEESQERCDEAITALNDADLILLYRTTHRFWDDIDDQLREISSRKPIICVGYDVSYWALTSVGTEIAVQTYQYLTHNGAENFRRLMVYLSVQFGGMSGEIFPPLEIPWQGVVHPAAGRRIFASTEEYLSWYPAKAGRPWVGVLMSRIAWVSEGDDIEKMLIADLEAQDLNVLPVFTNSILDDTIGSLNISGVISRYFFSDGVRVVDAVVKLITFLIGKVPGSDAENSAKSGAELLASLNVPVFQPVTTYYATLEEWKTSNGLANDITWAVAMPEFEGMIEPVMLGSAHTTRNEEYARVPIPDRSRKIAARVRRWLDLRHKPVSERKVVFILNNNPCESVEANVGSASHLDAGESVARVLQRMKEEGYQVDPPLSGKDLMQMFLDKKAISEFRWTTKQEIVRCGGTVYRMPASEYDAYFSSLPESAQEKMLDAWGEPPGEGMVLDGEILITGIRFGNVIVAVQPKRGCFGARCDGAVCKILHDPACPPTHQYLATYYYFQEVFGADAFVHVGTHGNLEFLPGKGTALSEECFPDIAAGTAPLLYIYNTDNPPEGTIAKRRAYATLVGHMQSVMAGSTLYDEYAELDQLLVQYETARHDPARCHALHHMILDAAAAAHLDELGVTHETPMDETVRRCHEALSCIRNSRIPLGMHVFGEIPEGDKRIEMIASILRYESDSSVSPRRAAAAVYGLELSHLLEHQGEFNAAFGMSNGALIEWLDERAKMMVRLTVAGLTDEDIAAALGRPLHPLIKPAMERILDLDVRIAASDELSSLMNGLSGGYIRPGPSGLVTHGRDDVLPSGRNFYSLDPLRVPTTSAWRVGSRLADALVAKYQDESGELPETVAFYWMAGDIMTADGEMMAEIFSLLGVEPVWMSNGQVRTFAIVAQERLTHPRIDVTVQTTCILRDNFESRIDLVDRAVAAVAALDEPDSVNFVRKHVQAEIAKHATSESDATARVFSAKPGTYTSGVNLAVFAGAWKTEQDLAEIHITTNGYAYGNGRGGAAAHEQFAANLETVSVTFNKVVSDEHDLLGCCCYFGNQGGLTAAARHLSGKPVKAYYGDTREKDHVEVRTLADELRRVVRTKLLNPKWIDGMKEHGYKGAADIMKRVTRVYGWEASTQEVDDWVFDDIAETFVNDPEMKQFFEENNPYALEEISRRLLEANSRGLWQPDPEVLDKLRSSYLEIESWLEERAGNGEFQGGAVDVVTADEVAGWGTQIADVMSRVHGRKKV